MIKIKGETLKTLWFF